MHNVLLVDDEAPIINGLKSLICWEGYNYTILKTAGNGLEALKLIKSIQFDLIITDIRMPGLTGLELIEKINELDYKGKIIILSGYAEFEYAKKAIKWGVNGYLLKPIDTEELLDLLIKMNAEFEEEESKLHVAKNSKTIIRDRSLRKLMLKGVMPPGNNAKADPLDFFQKGESFCSCILSFDDYQIISSEEGIAEADRIKASILNILKTEIEVQNYGYAIELDNSLIGILLIQNKDSGLSIKQIIQYVSKTAREKLPFPCSMAIGSRKSKSEQIHLSYLDAVKVLNYKLTIEKGKTLYYDDFDWLENTNFLLYKWDFQILIKAIKENDTTQINLSIDRFIVNVSVKSWPIEIVQSQIVLFIIELALLIENAGGEVSKLFNTDLILKKTYINKSLADLKLFLQSKCKEVSQWYKENISPHKCEKVIQKIVNYIETNYNKNINLKTISYDFKMNPVYLGRIFKQHTGKSFTNYINEYRIQHAVKLLKETDYSVTEICKLAGYNNINYFYQIFKKEHGVTPLELKRNMNG